MPGIMDSFPGVVAPAVVTDPVKVDASTTEEEGGKWKKADGTLTGLSIALIVIGCLLFLMAVISAIKHALDARVPSA
jgi:hypothetical protein